MSAEVESVLAGIREVVERHLDLPLEKRERLVASTRLRDDLALDSLQMFTLAVEVENHFLVRLTPEDDAEIETAGDLARVVARKLAQGESEIESAEGARTA